jgi:hypothetical protein
MPVGDRQTDARPFVVRSWLPAAVLTECSSEARAARRRASPAGFLASDNVRFSEAGGQHRTSPRPVQERLWRSTSSVLNRPQRGDRGAGPHADQARDTSSGAFWAVSAAAARC